MVDPSTIASTKSNEKLVISLGPRLAVKVLKPVMSHCRVEASAQVGAARVWVVRVVRERRGKRMVGFV